MTIPLDQLIAQASQLASCPAWSNLSTLAASAKHLSLGDLIDQPGRFETCSRQHDGLLVDFSRQFITPEILAELISLADQRELGSWVEHLFDGSYVNNTEHRAAQHMALRALTGSSSLVGDDDVAPAVQAELDHVTRFAESVRAGRYTGATGEKITDVVNIGIGGSDLGLVMADAALHHHHDGQIRAHFVSNIDGSQLADVLDALRPEATLFVICSKSFTTLETRLNADAARDWLSAQLTPGAVEKHFVAVSVNGEAMNRFGISSDHRFALWDWVGGRYSLWSAVGLTLAVVLGEVKFRELLAGAAAMDDHFRSAEWCNNLPVLLGLLAVWNQNFLGATSHAVLPYDQRLQHLPAFLQQLEMESNGKSVTRDGQPMGEGTGTVIWGQPGSNAQHSFFQLLHQGTASTAIDFIASVRASSRYESLHDHGLANMLAQAEAFAHGHSDEDPHRCHPGNRPSSIILIKELTPFALGALICMYEHKVFVQSVIWGTNPFDQWGVELGKTMAVDFATRLAKNEPDAALPGIANVFRAWRKD